MPTAVYHSWYVKNSKVHCRHQGLVSWLSLPLSVPGLKLHFESGRKVQNKSGSKSSIASLWEFLKGGFPFREAPRERDKENQLGPVIISSVCLAPLLSFFSFSQKTFLALYPSPISPLQQKLPWLEEQREEGERERENNKSELSHLSLLFFFLFLLLLHFRTVVPPPTWEALSILHIQQR